MLILFKIQIVLSRIPPNRTRNKIYKYETRMLEMLECLLEYETFNATERKNAQAATQDL